MPRCAPRSSPSSWTSSAAATWRCVFITHDLSLAWSLCDRIAVMYLGRVVEQGIGRGRDRAPSAPLHAGAGDRDPGARRPAAAGERELLNGELPDATAVPCGCRFHPRCPRRFEPCDRVDPELVPAGAADQLAACLLHDPARAPERRRRRRWVTAGATSPGRSACSSRGRATRSPTCPECAWATHRRRAASGPG